MVPARVLGSKPTWAVISPRAAASSTDYVNPANSPPRFTRVTTLELGPLQPRITWRLALDQRKGQPRLLASRRRKKPRNGNE